MPATANSPYQSIRVKHAANTPPNCDPQRANENFTTYFNRMQAQGLHVDIGATESDADYLVRISEYYGRIPVENISASYAVYAGTEIAPSPTSSFALRAGTANGITNALHVMTASLALVASNAPPSVSSSYLSGEQAVLAGTTSDNLTITNTSGRAIDARCSTSGNTIYAQAKVSQAVLAVQSATVLDADINVGALAAQRSVTDMAGGQPVAAVLTVLDQYTTGSAPLITAKVGSNEVFKVGKFGTFFVSGSQGLSGTITGLNIAGAAVTMSFLNGILTAVA